MKNKETLTTLLVERQIQLKTLIDNRTELVQMTMNHTVYSMPINALSTYSRKFIISTFKQAESCNEDKFKQTYLYYKWSKPCWTFEQWQQTLLPIDLKICLLIRQINNCKRKLGMIYPAISKSELSKAFNNYISIF